MAYTQINPHAPAHKKWFTVRGVNNADSIAILRLAAPVAGLSLVNMAMSVTDTVMTASFGMDALAAVAVGSDFYSIVFFLAIGCIGGLAPLYATAHAAGNESLLSRLRSAGWLVALCLTMPLTALIWLAPALLQKIGISAELVDLGAGYTRAMAMTFVPMLAVAVLRIRLTSIERPGLMFRITLAMVPLNVLFNYVFMFGAFGISGFGITGAGISSFVVAALTLISLISLGLRHDRGRFATARRSDIREIFQIGIPAGIATLAEVGIYLGATIYAATLSVNDAVAHSIAIRAGGVTFAAYIGLQQGAMVRLARLDNNPQRRREVMASSLAIGLAIGVGLFSLLVVLAGPLTAQILDGAEGAAGVAFTLLILLAVSDLAGPGAAVAGGLLRALKDTKLAMIYSLTGHWVLAAPLGILLTAGFGMGAIGIWIALTAGSLLASLLTVFALRRHVPELKHTQFFSELKE